MTSYTRMYTGNLSLGAEEACITGMISGDLLISPGATVRLKGVVSGDVHVRAATLLLDGIVKGSVFNHGGTLRISGLVGGAVHDSGVSA
jgi:cytoskeletal protein CcmA (bactofilin family)